MSDKKYKCTKCGEYKTSEHFGKASDNKNRDYLTFWCHACHREHYQNSKERLFKLYSLDRKLKAAFNGAKRRSKELDRYFDLDMPFMKSLWIKQNGKCAVSNIDMTYEHFCGRLNTNLSIDRIDSSKGYTRDNTQLVCMAVNQMKNDLSMGELIVFCKAIINQYENNKE